MEIRIRAILTSISTVINPWGERLVKLEFSEERELPGPMVIQKGRGSELAKEIVPVISQVLRSMPGFSGGKVRVPRLTIYLYEDEWDKMYEKPNINDTVEIIVSKGKLEIRRE